MKKSEKGFNPKAKSESIAAIESDDPCCGKNFAREICLMRHARAKFRELANMRSEYEPCAYCPRILNLIETEKQEKMSEKIIVKVKKCHPTARLPEYEMPGDSGFDLRTTTCGVIHPGSWEVFPLGLAFEIPEGFEIQIRPRSGLSLKTPLIAKNSIGTIDSGFKGEVCMGLYNSGSDPFYIEAGDRICQGVLQRVPIAEFQEVEELSQSKRGANGLGSTGVK